MSDWMLSYTDLPSPTRSDSGCVTSSDVLYHANRHLMDDSWRGVQIMESTGLNAEIFRLLETVKAKKGLACASNLNDAKQSSESWMMGSGK
jgi:hypothetical protein